MPISDSSPECLTCTVSGASAVTDASAAARAFGETQWLAEDELARLCIIIEELVANLYEHGGVTHEQEVALELRSEPGAVRIAIRDRGSPFDPRTAASLRKRTERGGNAGIDIVRAWALFVDYDVADDANRLELILPLAT